MSAATHDIRLPADRHGEECERCGRPATMARLAEATSTIVAVLCENADCDEIGRERNDLLEWISGSAYAADITTLRKIRAAVDALCAEAST